MEVMGRHTGWIALHAGLAGGAHHIVIPEVPFDVSEITKSMERRFQMGEKYGIIVVAEGAQPRPGTMAVDDKGVDEFGHRRLGGMGQLIGEEISRSTGYDVRTTVLGHVQRGGTPTAFDRVLASRFGVHATRAAHRGEFGSCVVLKGEYIETLPLAEVVSRLKTVPMRRYEIAQALFG